MSHMAIFTLLDRIQLGPDGRHEISSVELSLLWGGAVSADAEFMSSFRVTVRVCEKSCWETRTPLNSARIALVSRAIASISRRRISVALASEMRLSPAARCRPLSLLELAVAVARIDGSVRVSTRRLICRRESRLARLCWARCLNETRRAENRMCSAMAVTPTRTPSEPSAQFVEPATAAAATMAASTTKRARIARSRRVNLGISPLLVVCLPGVRSAHRRES